MADAVKLVLWCPAEGVPIGVLEGDIGARVSSDFIGQSFRVSPEFEAIGYSRHSLAARWRDGFPALCPRCANVCAWAPPGPDSREVALREMFDAPLGSFTLAGPSPRKGAAVRPGARLGVDPALRAVPLISDDPGGDVSGPDGTLTEPPAGGRTGGQ